MLLAGALAMLMPAMALAQATYPTGAPGVRAPGTVPLQCNASNANCVPVTAANPLPVTSTSGGSGGTADQVQGNIASGTADSGNPVKIGGRASSAAPTAVSGGARVNAWYSLNGAAIVTGTPLIGADGVANEGLVGFPDPTVGTVRVPMTATLLYNGSGAWDRVRDVTSANGTSGIGLAGAGLLGWNGTTYARLTTGAAATDANAGAGVLNIAPHVFNGASWDRLRGDTTGLHVVNKGGATIATGHVAVTTSATLVAAARAGREKITLSPTSSVVYYVGATGVTSATGLYVAAGEAITLDTAAAVYAVGESAVTISFVELY
jgi:hypothetical protein